MGAISEQHKWKFGKRIDQGKQILGGSARRHHLTVRPRCRVQVTDM